MTEKEGKREGKKSIGPWTKYGHAGPLLINGEEEEKDKQNWKLYFSIIKLLISFIIKIMPIVFRGFGTGRS